MNNALITLAVVDAYQVFREALTSLLNRTPGFAVTAQAAGGDELVILLQGVAPDVVLLSAEIAGMSAPKCVAAIRAHYPTLPVLFLFKNDEAQQCPFLKDAPNVSSFLLQRASGEQLIETIRRCAISSTEPHQHQPLNRLTRQEKAVLRLVLAEFSNEEIAVTLSKSVRTIEGHRRSIYHKTGAHNIAGIMRVALRQGLVSLDELDDLAKLLKPRNF